ncbi:MAG: hypothetical protein HZA89_09820 [Verrucomicrobia bacterium]|nr:hypothetical protein [Verrucomicrobiota bacterium]
MKTQLTLPALLTSLALVAAPALTAADAPAKVTREAVLENLARHVLAPAYGELAAKARALADAVDKLAASPGADALGAARAARTNAIVAWRHTQVFNSGPIADPDQVGQINFWPARGRSIEQLLREGRPLDKTFKENLGSASAGLSAIEYLLFTGGEGGPAAALAGEPGARRRGYLKMLADDVAARAADVARLWKESDYVKRFVAEGQDSLNLVVNRLLEAYELSLVARLRVVMEMQKASQFNPDRIEGGASLTSRQNALELLRGCEEILLGGQGAGLGDYLKQKNPALETSLRAALQATRKALADISVPLEKVAPEKQGLLAKAETECVNLERLIKADLASALGVTITFSANDGD